VDAETEQDFREFVAARWPSLYRAALLLTGQREAAEDLVQTALAKVASKWKRLDQPEPKLPSCPVQALPTPAGWYSSDSYLIACTRSPEINVVNVNGQVERTVKLPFGSSLMPNTSGGKVGKLDGVTFAASTGFPGSGGIRF
jgi:hypothetical protein